MVKTDFIEVLISKKNKKHYTNKGYLNLNVGDVITIKVEDIPEFSKQEIDIQCDYCGTVFSRKIYNHTKQKKNELVSKDSCVNCKKIKTKESNLIKYGVENVFDLETVQDKIKQTLILNYGVEHPMYSEEIKEKLKSTNLEKYGCDFSSQNEKVKEKYRTTMLERYGVEYYTQTDEYIEKSSATNILKYGFKNAFQNPEIQNKQKTTCLDRYGCENVFQNEEIKEKLKATNLERYGFESPMQNNEIKMKSLINQKKSLYENGNVQESKQQRYICNIIGGELNYPVDYLNLDIAFPNEKIYIEYNGGGHDLQVKIGRISEKEMKLKDIKRYQFLKKLGWKAIIINSKNDYLPLEQVLLNELNIALYQLKNTNTNHYTINISDTVIDDKFGHLHKIK